MVISFISWFCIILKRVEQVFNSWHPTHFLTETVDRKSNSTILKQSALMSYHPALVGVQSYFTGQGETGGSV